MSSRASDDSIGILLGWDDFGVAHIFPSTEHEPIAEI